MEFGSEETSTIEIGRSLCSGVHDGSGVQQSAKEGMEASAVEEVLVVFWYWLKLLVGHIGAWVLCIVPISSVEILCCSVGRSSSACSRCAL